MKLKSFEQNLWHTDIPGILILNSGLLLKGRGFGGLEWWLIGTFNYQEIKSVKECPMFKNTMFGSCSDGLNQLWNEEHAAIFKINWTPPQDAVAMDNLVKTLLFALEDVHHVLDPLAQK